MKICKIWIKDWDQFKDIELDFTDPSTGEPVEKICFIGSNGTGKSKLLECIDELLHNLGTSSGYILNDMAIEISQDKSKYYLIFINDDNDDSDYETLPGLLVRKTENNVSNLSLKEIYQKVLSAEIDQLKNPFNAFTSEFKKKLAKSVFIYSPAESMINDYLTIYEGARTSIEDVISKGEKDNDQSYFKVSQSTVSDFWNTFSSDLYSRKIKRDAYEELPENLNKTKKNLLKEFELLNPKFEDKLTTTWNRILERSNLYLDNENIKLPENIKDSIKVPIKLKGTQSVVTYNLLSTGIRNYIFRLGHIYSLYFNREIDTGFLLVDEPENALYPDFLYDIIDIYKEVCTDKRGQMNTQMFFATHNPIIAAQFKPHERIILEWNDDGTVSSHKGVAPEGDDPNDILRKDFELTDLMGKAGKDMWVKYVELKSKLNYAKSFEEKEKLISEINQIGSLYNF